MGITTIKRIHNLVPSRGDGAVTVTVRNAELNRSFFPDFEFRRREDREVNWRIPWAWEESHFTMDRRHIDITRPGRRGVFSIWQQDKQIWMTEDGTFTGARTSLGGIDGERRLVITEDDIRLIGMLDALPPVRDCLDFGAPPYTLHTSGTSDAHVLPEGNFGIANEMWFARYHATEAGFGKRFFFPNGGHSMQFETKWSLNPSIIADGLGYARIRIILRLEVRPEDLRTGAVLPPIIREEPYLDERIVVGFLQPAGNFHGDIKTLSLTLNQHAPTDNYLLRAFVRSEVGGAGWVNAKASCSGQFMGFKLCRL